MASIADISEDNVHCLLTSHTLNKSNLIRARAEEFGAAVLLALLLV